MYISYVVNFYAVVVIFEENNDEERLRSSLSYS